MTPELILAHRFASAWRKPQASELTELLHPETTLYQPHLPPIRGIAKASREFSLFLEWMPNFHGVVDHTVGQDGRLFIEWQMKFPFQRKTISIDAVDSIFIEDDLIKSRVVYFNTLPLIKEIAKSPREWKAYYKYRFAAR